jgi:hypothetical protein
MKIEYLHFRTRLRLSRKLRICYVLRTPQLLEFTMASPPDFLAKSVGEAVGFSYETSSPDFLAFIE